MTLVRETTFGPFERYVEVDDDDQVKGVRCEYEELLRSTVDQHDAEHDVRVHEQTQRSADGEADRILPVPPPT
jgi:hypothetical protein